MMKETSINDIAACLQKRLEQYHPLDEIITVLEESLSRFHSSESLWNYIVEHENGLYLSFEDGINIIL